MFGLVIGMAVSCVAMAGWIIGYFYADPSQAAAHPIIHPLARIAVIACPIALLGGVGIFGWALRYELSRRKRPPLVRTPVPQGLQGFTLLREQRREGEAEAQLAEEEPQPTSTPEG